MGESLNCSNTWELTDKGTNHQHDWLAAVEAPKHDSDFLWSFFHKDMGIFIPSFCSGAVYHWANRKTKHTAMAI